MSLKKDSYLIMEVNENKLQLPWEYKGSMVGIKVPERYCGFAWTSEVEIVSSTISICIKIGNVSPHEQNTLSGEKCKWEL
jgi:hypothetical protein